MNKKEFNYCIAYYWHRSENDALAVYPYGSEIHFGTQKDANEFLKYVKRKESDHDWKIFKININENT